MSRQLFPTPYAGAYYPIYGHDPNEYLVPTDRTPFDKVNTLFIAFAHAYPLDPKNLDAGAELAFQKDQPDQAARLNKVMYFARRANPNIKFIISLGWAKQDWTYISRDYTGGKRNFARSVLAFVREYQFDGFDIDDEFIGDNPDDCHASSGCITQENFNAVIADLRSGFDVASRKDGKPYYLTITPAFYGTGHVTKANVKNFDLINPQTYSGTRPQQFLDIGAVPRQLSWGIDTEQKPVAYPSPSDYEKLAGLFNWSMSSDGSNYDFEYTNQIARDVHYPPMD